LHDQLIFLDLEIAEVVKNYSDEKKHDKKVNKSAKKVDKNTKNHGNKNDKNEKTKSNIVKNDNNQKIDDDSNTNVEISEENNNDVKDMNMDINDYSIEVINKDVSTLKENEQLKIIKRDNPELIGIIEELGKITLELEHANKYRLLSIKKQFDDGIKDGTLFCDLLRLYAATLAFYLRLKSNGEVDKKHPIFDKMLQLRRRAEVMRPVYKKTLHLLLKILQNEKK